MPARGEADRIPEANGRGRQAALRTGRLAHCVTEPAWGTHDASGQSVAGGSVGWPTVCRERAGTVNWIAAAAPAGQHRPADDQAA